jgi:hypothetical protein
MLAAQIASAAVVAVGVAREGAVDRKKKQPGFDPQDFPDLDRDLRQARTYQIAGGLTAGVAGIVAIVCFLRALKRADQAEARR